MVGMELRQENKRKGKVEKRGQNGAHEEEKKLKVNGFVSLLSHNFFTNQDPKRV